MNDKEHMDFAVIREDFNIYEVENGQILKTKQILTDIILETTEDNRKMTNLGIKDISFVITKVDVDTSGLQESTPDLVTEKDHVRELKFKPIREVVNIYETSNMLLFLISKLKKVFLTNKKDKTGYPILRYETLAGFNTLSKDSLELSQRPLAPILTKSQLDIFSERYLSELCRKTSQIIERACRKREIYDELRLGAFLEEGIPQVIDEIVQHLMLKGLITYGDNKEEIRLTATGVKKCQDFRYKP